MKKKWYIVLVMVLVLLNINVYADDVCESSELTRIRKLAEKVEFSYDYEVKELTTPGGTVNKYIEYSISAINLNEDLQVVIMEDYYANKFTEFKGDSEGKATLKPFLEGDKVNITIYAYTENACSGKKITTKTITLPYYNKYHDLEICHPARDYDYCMAKYFEDYCNELQKFKYCQEFIDESVSQDKFNTKVNDFMKGRLPHYYNYIYEPVNNTWLYITIGGIVVLAIIGFVVVRIKKKNRNKLKISKSKKVK